MQKTVISQNSFIDRLKYIWSVLFFAVGFILSPLTWWNDLVVNVPIAWFLASFFRSAWFKPAFIVFYWATNIVGMLMMHFSGSAIIHKKVERLTWKSMSWSLLVAVMYSLLFWLAISFKIIKPINFSTFAH